MRLLEHLVGVDNLDAMLVSLLVGILADGSEVRVHHKGRRGGVLDIARSMAIDLWGQLGHVLE